MPGRVEGPSVGVTGSEEEEEEEELAVDIESVEEGGVAIVEARGVRVLAVGLRPSRRTTSVLSTSIGERKKERQRRWKREPFIRTYRKKRKPPGLCDFRRIGVECLK